MWKITKNAYQLAGKALFKNACLLSPSRAEENFNAEYNCCNFKLQAFEEYYIYINYYVT